MKTLGEALDNGAALLCAAVSENSKAASSTIQAVTNIHRTGKGLYLWKILQIKI